MHVRTEHDHRPRPLSPRLKADARRTWLAWGAATLLSSHAGTSPTGDERHSESQSGPQADSVKASQLAAGRSLPRGRTSPPQSKQQAAVSTGPASAFYEIRCPTARPFRGTRALPLAHQRGDRPRRRDPRRRARAHRRTQELRSRRRSTPADRYDGGWRPAGQRRCSSGWRGTPSGTEPAESEAESSEDRPPQANGPSSARARPRALDDLAGRGFGRGDVGRSERRERLGELPAAAAPWSSATSRKDSSGARRRPPPSRSR